MFDWTTDVGSVDATGFFTAQTTPGIGIVTATNGTVSGSAAVTVVVGPCDYIIVLPDPITIIVNGIQQFTATAYDVYNNIVPGVTFIWWTDVGIVDGTGLFTAQALPGIGTVEATNDTVTGIADVEVVDVVIDHIIVLPNPVMILVDGTQAFTATAYDQFGIPIAGVDFVWWTDVGIVDGTGFFTAQAIPGLGTVEATNGTVTGVANVEVVDDPPIADAGPDQIVIQGTTVFLDGSQSTDDVGITWYTWTFDDGTGPQIIWGSNPTHMFVLPGSFLVTLTVEDRMGQTDSDVMNVNVGEYTFNIDLEMGWNLISIPLEMSNTSIENVLSSIAGQWDYVQYYDSTDPADPWKTYATFKPAMLNDLWFIDNTMGFWIHMANSATLTVYGTMPASTNIQLWAGWNLIGYPSFNTTTTIADALVGTNYDGVEGFDAAQPYRLIPLADTYVMTPGEGYWVHVPSDVVWNVLKAPPIGDPIDLDTTPSNIDKAKSEPGSRLDIGDVSPTETTVSVTDSRDVDMVGPALSTSFMGFVLVILAMLWIACYIRFRILNE